MRAYCWIIISISFALRSVFALGNEAIISCQDVTKLDFKNLKITREKRTFAFTNGVATNYDMPEIENSAPPDWEAKIEQDTVVYPESGTTVRFLLVDDSHLTGSGSNQWLVGYSCSNGRLRQAFSHDGLSLKIKRLDVSGIVISMLLKYGNPNATHWTYIWDKKRSTYVLSSSWSDTDPKHGRKK